MSADLLVVALGGNAVSPPGGDQSLAAERAAVETAVGELAPLAARHRLLVVHGNGPQVGRLLAAGPEDPALDVRVAQPQGELGYLVVEALDRRLGRDASVAVVTRVLVAPDDPAFDAPDKPIGPVLAAPPAGVAAARTPDGRGWRRVVASPRPTAVLELEAVRVLLRTHHVVAGGGGGVALAATEAGRHGRAAVVDKDHVAALLAVALDARTLVFVTDVPHAFDGFGRATARPIRAMRAAEARERLARGVFAPGSMAPKVASAVAYVAATGRRATIAALGAVEDALAGRTGTSVVP